MNVVERGGLCKSHPCFPDVFTAVYGLHEFYRVLDRVIDRGTVMDNVKIWCYWVYQPPEAGAYVKLEWQVSWKILDQEEGNTAWRNMSNLLEQPTRLRSRNKYPCCSVESAVTTFTGWRWDDKLMTVEYAVSGERLLTGPLLWLCTVKSGQKSRSAIARSSDSARGRAPSSSSSSSVWKMWTCEGRWRYSHFLKDII